MLKETLVEAIEQSIKQNWDITALTDFGEKGLTYGDVGSRIIWFHNLFRQLHIHPGDKIALLGKNSVNWAVTYLSTITFGAVVVPILPDFHTTDIHGIVTHSDASLLIAEETLYEKLDEDKMPECQGIISMDSFDLLYHKKKGLAKAFNAVTGDSEEGETAGIKINELKFDPVDLEETASINYTSGTSGFSKGVELAHASLMSNIRYGQDNMPLSKGDRILSFLPLAHAYGCAFEFLFPFTLGCHITFLKKTPSPRIIMEAFSKIKPNLILSVPLIIEKIYRKQIKPLLKKTAVKAIRKIPPIDKLLKKKIYNRLQTVFGGEFRELVIGGAALNPEVEKFFQSINFPITIGYGMTECGPLISYSSWNTTKLRSVGRPVDRMEIKIDSHEPSEIPGEILVRGVNVMKGYYKNPEQTSAAIDKNGWLHTGDLGLIDNDGFVFIKGRTKDMILGPSGQNIYPEEIESKLNNLDYVTESLVIERNNKINALVYPDFDRVHSENLKEDELKKHMEEILKQLNSILPAYSRVGKIEIYPEEFEKTPTKKIKRFLYTIAASGKSENKK